MTVEEIGPAKVWNYTTTTKYLNKWSTFHHQRKSWHSWQWVTFCDPWHWPTRPIVQLTRDPHPMTRSQTMAWVDHDYSRIMTSLRLLTYLLCNDVQSGILDTGLFSEYFYSIYSKSSSSLHSTRQILKAEHGEQFLDFSSVYLLHVYTSPNHGSSVLRYWPVTHVTHSHLLTHLTHWPPLNHGDAEMDAQ